MNNIENVHEAAEAAKSYLEGGIRHTKVVDARTHTVGIGIAQFFSVLEKAGVLEKLLEVNTELVEMITSPNDGYGEASTVLHTLKANSSNLHLQQALALSEQAKKSYDETVIEIIAVTEEVYNAVGQIITAVTTLETVAGRIQGVRDSLHTVSGAWDGPVGQGVAPLLGRETVSGIAPAAVAEVTQYQADIAASSA